MAGEEIPTCVLPEVEVFLGPIPTARYETPGAQHFAETVTPHVNKAMIVVLKNHGTVAWGETLQQAYWWTEILDAYCRILMLARSLGGVHYFSEQKERELLELKDKWGYKDPRNTEEYKNCDICANDIFRDSWRQSGVQRRAFEPPPAMEPPAMENKGSENTGNASQDQEPLIQAITDQVMEALAHQS